MTRKVNVDLSNSIEAWRQKTNLLSDYIGDLDNLSIASPHDSSVVSAINRLDALSLTTAQVRNLITTVQSGPTGIAAIIVKFHLLLMRENYQQVLLTLLDYLLFLLAK
jgi:hypothetical protein